LVDTNNLTGYAQVVEELVSGQVTKQYTYGLDLISQRQLSGVSFYNYDGHGSVRKLSDSLGNVTDTYTYDAFGTLIEQTGTTSNSYLYAGEQFDSDLGFYYNRARYLNVETGRFISQDTFEGSPFEPKSLHKYLYAEVNPVSNLDPSGKSIISEIQALHIRATAFVSSVGVMIQRAFQNGTIGNFWRQLGENAERFAEAVLAMKPNLIVERNLPVANRFIDFFVRLGDRSAFIEVKYSLPAKLGPSMDRLVAQVTAATNSNQGQVVVWTLKEPTMAQVRLVLAQTNNAQVQFVHGVEGLYNWIHLYFGV
jgi:RHS repeat-associated protein